MPGSEYRRIPARRICELLLSKSKIEPDNTGIIAATSRNILCGWDEVILVVGLTWEHESRTYGRL